MDLEKKNARNITDIDMNSADDGAAGAQNQFENAEDFEIDESEQRKETAMEKIVLPGDYIGEGFIAGHGTYEKRAKGKNGQLIYASMAGVVH